MKIIHIVANDRMPYYHLDLQISIKYYEYMNEVGAYRSGPWLSGTVTLALNFSQQCLLHQWDGTADRSDIVRRAVNGLSDRPGRANRGTSFKCVVMDENSWSITNRAGHVDKKKRTYIRIGTSIISWLCRDIIYNIGRNGERSTTLCIMLIPSASGTRAKFTEKSGHIIILILITHLNHASSKCPKIIDMIISLKDPRLTVKHPVQSVEYFFEKMSNQRKLHPKKVYVCNTLFNLATQWTGHDSVLMRTGLIISINQYNLFVEMFTYIRAQPFDVWTGFTNDSTSILKMCISR